MDIDKEVIIGSFTHQQLLKFNPVESGLNELREKYMPLKIDGLDDKAGYLAVRAARLDVKSKRVEVDKLRKILNEDANRHVKSVNKHAKGIIDELEAIENHLEKMEDHIDNERERIKQEAAKAKAIMIQTRINQLFEAGFRFDGAKYVLKVSHENIDYVFEPLQIETQDQSQFDENIKLAREMADIIIKQAAEKKAIEDAERAQVDAERAAHQAQIQADREALARERAEIAAEKERLAQLNHEAQERQKAAIDFENAKRDAEMKRAEEFRKDLKSVKLSVQDESGEIKTAIIEPLTDNQINDQTTCKNDPSLRPTPKLPTANISCACCGDEYIDIVQDIKYCPDCSQRIVMYLNERESELLAEIVEWLKYEDSPDFEGNDLNNPDQL